MALEFYIVTNCPMKGLYRNLKTAKRQCQRYETAALHRFFSPGDISAARACCNGDGIKVTKKTWDDLYFAGKMTTVVIPSKRQNMPPRNETTPKEPETQTETPIEKDSNVIDITALTEKQDGAVNKPPTLIRKRKPKYGVDTTNPILPKDVDAVIYTDGSFINIGKKKYGGYAALILLRKMGDVEFMISGNRKNAKDSEYMELLAINKALKQLKKYKVSGKVALFCDSKVLVEMYNTKLQDWKNMHWRQNNGKRVKKWRLWRKIWKKSRGLETELHWVKGHSGSIWNIRCDHAAKVEAKILAM